MASYADGQGHKDLATRLAIDTSHSLARAGSCNSRILRTTLKDSYLTSEATFYVIGMTFLFRSEFPINNYRDPFEGRWISTQHKSFSETDQCIPLWSSKDTDTFVGLKRKFDLFSMEEIGRAHV